MKKGIFSKSVSVLLVAVLAATTIFQNQWLVIGLFAAWLLFLVGGVLFAKHKHIACWVKSLAEQPKPEAQIDALDAIMLDIPDASDSPSMVALRHLNFRISDKLKSVCPDVTWNWEKVQPNELAINGGTGRIKLYQAGEFSHAEITVDQLARIEFQMLKLVDINVLLPHGQGKESEPTIEPVTTDAIAWFDLVGREQLTSIVTELNTRNHRKLSIIENGDIFVVEDDASVKQGTLENMPSRNFWNELSKLIADTGINAQISGDQLRLTW